MQQPTEMFISDSQELGVGADVKKTFKAVSLQTKHTQAAHLHKD